jgi:hypothetical protein
MVTMTGVGWSISAPCRWRSSTPTAPHPGPAWDVRWAAWRWVPFFRDEKCRAIGLPTGVANKAHRLRLLLDAYGIERDLDIVRAGIDRARHMLEQQLQFAARGSAWEIELDRRGIFGEADLEIAWVEEHAVALIES